jgi:predicted TIM-barrel enzyme
MAKTFPDLNKDGQVTKADVLVGRGVVEKKAGGTVKAKEGKWIQSAIKNPGSLRKQLGIKGDKKIPAKMLDRATKAPGKLGQRARLAKTLRGMK